MSGRNLLADNCSRPEFSGMQLVEIKIEVNAATIDSLETILLDLGVAGWSLLEDIIEKRAWIVGIFCDALEASAAWTELSLLLAGMTVGQPMERLLADEDWKNSYKIHFKAWKFGRLNWVPIWEQDIFVLPTGEEVLWLDPGMAFGTGNHETTRLVVERLVRFAEGNNGQGRVIDAGCGSGILALSAAKLGFLAVSGFDNDAEAILVSEKNAALNGIAGKVEFYTGDLVTGLVGRQAELILANIQADVLRAYARQLCSAVAPSGQLVLSGILSQELAQVREEFTVLVPSWRIETRILGEWADLSLTRTS